MKSWNENVLNRPNGIYQFILFIFLLFLHFSLFSIEERPPENQTNITDTTQVRKWIDQGHQSWSNSNDSAHYYFTKALTLSEEIDFTEGKLEAFGPLGYLEQINGNLNEALWYYQQSLDLKTKAKDTSGMIQSYISMAQALESLPRPDSAAFYYEKAAHLQEESGDLDGLVYTAFSMGTLYSVHAGYSKALNYFNRAKRLNETVKNANYEALILNGIGLIYYNQREDDKSLKYYRQSLEIFEEIGNHSRLAMVLNNMGLIYQRQGDLDRAKKNYQESLNLKKAIDDPHGMAYSLNHLGNVYLAEYKKDSASRNDKLLDSALYYFNFALEIRQNIDDGKGKSISNNSIAEVYLMRNRINLAEKFALKSYSEANALGLVVQIRNAANQLRQIYRLQNKGIEALDMQSIYFQMRDSINNRKALAQSLELEAQHEFEKQKLLDQAKYDQLLSNANQKKERQELISVFVIFAAVFLLISLFIIINRLRTTRRQKTVIEEQKSKVDEAYELLGEKNKEILDSITYAQRIQHAILPPQNLVDELLPESFIFYQPKDIVAGDFYWLEHNENHTFFAAADCTGHGVPGAMVSVVCNNALNRSVREYQLKQPGLILDRTREIVVEELDKGKTGVRDGMDIALCVIEGETLQYAGANNPLWLIRNNELFEFKADKQPVGNFEHPKPYQTHEIALQKGDIIYIFSDGFADQFGGSKGKKFKSANLKKLLLAIHQKEIKEQKEALELEFDKWKGPLEQLDDVCIMGVRF